VPVSRRGKFDPVSRGRKSRAKPTYTQIFGDWLCDMAVADWRLSHYAGDARRLGMVRFSEEHPEAISMSDRRAACAHLAAGLRRHEAVVAIYSTFLQPLRSTDPRCALQNLPVVSPSIVPDWWARTARPMPARSIVFLRCIPNMTVMAPSTRTNPADAVHRIP